MGVKTEGRGGSSYLMIRYVGSKRLIMGTSPDLGRYMRYRHKDPDRHPYNRIRRYRLQRPILRDVTMLTRLYRVPHIHS